MKLLLIISLIACGYAAKLDRTYLPPSSAASAGGSPGSLLAPGSGSLGQTSLSSSNGFGRQPSASPGFGGPSYGQGSAKPGASQSGQPGFQSAGQPSGAYNQPSGPSGFGQQSGPSGFGSGAYNQPSGSAGSGQSSGPGFGPSGAGQFNIPTSSQSNFNQGSSIGPNQESYNIQAYNQPQRAQAAAEQGAQILKYDNQNDGETFAYSFETSNGIRAEESGIATNGVRAQGGFGYTGDDGQDYSITYTADENGFQPQGQHLPTPHPIPEEILKSIEENARAAAAGTQEGAYRPEEYENDGSSQSYNSAGSFNRPGQGPSQQYGPSKFGSGPNQSTQGYGQQGNQGLNVFGQNQNQGSGQGNRGQQPTSAQGNQYKEQGQFGPSESASTQFGSSINRGPQGQSSFGQNVGANQAYGQPSFGQSGSNQGQGTPFGQGNGFNQAKGQNSFGQGSANQSPGFVGQGGSGQSGYEYNRPQATGQFGSQFPGQSGPQGSSTFSQPGSGPNQGSLGSSAPGGGRPSFGSPGQAGQGSTQGSLGSSAPGGGRPSYGIPGQAGQGPAQGSLGSSAPGGGRPSYGSPGQAGQGPTFGSGPSGSSPFNQTPSGSQGHTGSAIGQPGLSANQGRPDNFSGPRQPPSFNAQEGYKY